MPWTDDNGSNNSSTAIGLEFNWQGRELGIKREDEANYQYVDLEGAPGNSLEFNWNGTQLGIRVQGELSYTYVDLKGDTGATGAQGIQGIQGDKGDKGDTGVGVGLEYDWRNTELGIKREDETDYQYVDLEGAAGSSLEFNWNDTQLGVRVQGDVSYTYVDLKGDTGDTGAPGPTDWNALPDTNPKAFTHSDTQTFTGSTGFVVEQTYPLAWMKSPDAGQDDFAVYFYQNRVIVVRDRDKNGVWEQPHPIDIYETDKRALVYGASVWHSENLPKVSGDWSPYPQGTGWTYTSTGTYSRQGSHVIVRGRLDITVVGTSTVLSVEGLPYTPTQVNFCVCRITNLANMPSNYSLTGYVNDTFFRPQYVSGTNGALGQFGMDKLTTSTQVWFLATYAI